MSGTNFRTGVSTRDKYSGSTTANLKSGVASKFVKRQAVIHCDAQVAITQTAFTLPVNAVVNDVMLNVLTLDAGITVDVGTMGVTNDPNGFLAAVSVATAGVVVGDLVDGAITLGALLFEETGTGADVANARRPNVTAGGDPVSYICSAGADTAVFDIVIDYTEVLNEAQ